MQLLHGFIYHQGVLYRIDCDKNFYSIVTSKIILRITHLKLYHDRMILYLFQELTEKKK